MFREMRKRDRQVSDGEAREILARAENGVLATVGEGGWPYAVPLSHVMLGDVLYIHCASEGHKLDNIANEARVSYCAVASAKVIPESSTVFYESAVVFGRAGLVTNEDEKRKALISLISRFRGECPANVEESLDKCAPETSVIRIRIERITGKAHREAPTS